MIDDAESHEAGWTQNYFNYYTEIEEHFQRARGSSFFLLSPLDWALIENWKASGVPVEAVLKGIDAAFEKWRGRKTKRRQINSLAYCAQAIAETAQRTPVIQQAENVNSAVFTVEEIQAYLMQAATAMRSNTDPLMIELASGVEALAAEAENYLSQLEDLERRLTALEEKMIAVARSRQSDDELYGMRATLDRELKPYRAKMTAEQLAFLEQRYLNTAVLEKARLPRLSLFYLH